MFNAVSPQIDFPAKERELLEHWYKDGIVAAYLHKNDNSKKRFSFMDGPITANNPMGVHHAWGRTYKDLWQRFCNMRGYKERFQNGFDCQGLWVEVEVEKELGIKNKKEIENLIPGDKIASIAKFVDLCKERVLKFSKIQTEQSKRLGYFMDWDHSYYTMSDENNYTIWYFLKVCYEKGWIYKGADSVPWCPRCQTAISQHEMLTEDYKELTHETVFVKLPITTKGWENTSLLIWTTTPWTVPANVAVGVNTKCTYGIWRNTETGENIILMYKNEFGEEIDRVHKGKAEPIAEYIFGREAIHKKTVMREKEVSGKTLVGISYRAPFDDLPIVEKARKENPEIFHTVIDGSEIVVSTEGTGLLHIATGAGKEDFDLGKKEHLPIISPIDDEANYVSGMGQFSGQNAKKHPEIIIDYLRSFDGGKFLLKSMGYTHRYPACWRCKTELVWKVTEEWYIAMDKQEKNDKMTLREQMKETAKKIKWHPAFGLDRELDWLSNMHDWLISKKNRYWGLALPIYECKKCNTFMVIGSKEELQKKALKGWDIFAGHTPHKPFIDAVKISCDTCGEIVSRINDVGNVWLDAGIVPFSTLVDPKTKQVSYMADRTYWQQWFPADFITESFPGQFKNWFYSLIAMSTVLEKTNPFKTVLGYASMLAEDGRPMHKSWGNAIEFHEGADTIGVDVMRWMFFAADPEQNILFGYKKADETRRRFHLMLWNVYNFFVTYANVDGWEKGKKGKQSILDKWILARLNETIQEVTHNLEQYDSFHAAKTLEAFVADLSLWYVRRSRDRVGPDVENTEDKYAFYATLYEVLTTLMRLLAPIIPFLADEVYINLTGETSVHLADWPQTKEIINNELILQMQQVRKIVELGLAQRKEKGIKVRQPLAGITVHPGKNETKFENTLDYLLLDEVNVKHVAFVKKGKDETAVVLDITLTPELQAEGKAREIVRQIQEERKKLGTSLTEKVAVTLTDYPKHFEEYIKKKALINKLTRSSVFQVTRFTS
ncbi:MAG TPA: isoleucine--tRNA ligase [Patescibacteria group bacterium]|nr:isoleucine--tRNA ligase [Patescibacteria group bacterium]